MTFLRAFPFAFSILWRYIIALPALLIALILYGFVSVLLVFLAAFISPMIGILIMIGFSVGATVIPVMVGLRVGLQAYDIKPRASYVGMMKSAVGYGFFEAVAAMILLAGVVGIYLAVTPVSPADLLGLNLDDLDEAVPETEGLGVAEQIAVMADFLAISPVLAWVLAGTIWLGTFALRAALLVPFAGAAIGADPNGRPHTPFFGFGQGFVAVFALVILSQIGLATSVPIAIYLLDFVGISQAAMMQIMLTVATLNEFSDIANLRSEAWILGGTVVLLMLFFFSLQCAGAVLVFAGKRALVSARHKAFDEELRRAEERQRPMKDTDLRELVRSRMPERKY